MSLEINEFVIGWGTAYIKAGIIGDQWWLYRCLSPPVFANCLVAWIKFVLQASTNSRLCLGASFRLRCTIWDPP